MIVHLLSPLDDTQVEPAWCRFRLACITLCFVGDNNRLNGLFAMLVWCLRVIGLCGCQLHT
jgi:hypothetical protein